MHAFQAGWQGWQTYNPRALVPSAAFPWDDYQSAVFRYTLYEAYAANTAYSYVQRFSDELKRVNKLYQHIRGIYNPVARLVDSYADRVYSGALDFETLETGAVPLVFADRARADQLRGALRRVWLWSNLRTAKDLYVRWGALLGDVAIKVVDNPARGRVRLEVLHPAKVRELELDAVGNVQRAVIAYPRTDPVTRETYTYREELDKKRFATFRDDEPYAFMTDTAGRPAAAWPNPYGFVPLVWVQHRSIGQARGVNAFYAQLGKIDELNDAASLLGDAVRKAVNPMLRATGFTAGTELKVTAAERDDIPVLYGPAGSAIEPLTPALDIAAAGANIDRLLQELERDLPELALHRLRDGGNLTAPGVRAAYSDAIGRFRNAMSTYDDGLVRAQKMALSIGGFRRYPDFDGITLNSYDAGELEHYVAERPIVEDALTVQERIAALTALPDDPSVARLVLEEMGYSQQRIDDVLTALTPPPVVTDALAFDLRAAVEDIRGAAGA